jgi:hypothetical protein
LETGKKNKGKVGDNLISGRTSVKIKMPTILCQITSIFKSFFTHFSVNVVVVAEFNYFAVVFQCGKHYKTSFSDLAVCDFVQQPGYLAQWVGHLHGHGRRAAVQQGHPCRLVQTQIGQQITIWALLGPTIPPTWVIMVLSSQKKHSQPP